jgi:hypothetical protein
MVLQVLPFVCGEANVDCCVCYVGLDCVQAHVLSFVELGSYVIQLGIWLLMVKPFEVWLYSFYLLTSSTFDFEHGNEIELVLMRGISGTWKLFLIYGK